MRTGCPPPRREVPVAEPLARFLARMPARTVQVVRLALRTFEFLPFPWRFSRMSVEARSQYMAKMEGSRFSLYRDLLLLAKLLAMIGWARDDACAVAWSASSPAARSREGEPQPTSTGSATSSLGAPERNATSRSSAPAPAGRPPRRSSPRPAST